MLFEIPEDLHEQFKIHVKAKYGKERKMSLVIRQLIIDYMQLNEPKSNHPKN